MKKLLLIAMVCMGCGKVAPIKKTYDKYCKKPMPDGYCIAQNQLTGEYIVRARKVDYDSSYDVLKSYTNGNLYECRLYPNTLGTYCQTMKFTDTCEAKYYIIEYLNLVKKDYYKTIN